MDAPPPLPSKNIASRWLIWVLVTLVLPALPFIVTGKGKGDFAGILVVSLTGFAIVAQCAASVWIAVGLAKARGLGAGAIVALSIGLTIGSLAVGSAIFFVACVNTVTWDFK